MNATWTQAFTVGWPMIAPALALGAWGLKMLSDDMKKKNCSAALVRITAGAATAAGNVAIQLSQLPADSRLPAVRLALIAAGAAAMQNTYASSIAIAAVTPAQLTSEVSGALGQNALHAVVVASLPVVTDLPTPPLGALLGLHHDAAITT